MAKHPDSTPSKRRFDKEPTVSFRPLHEDRKGAAKALGAAAAHTCGAVPIVIVDEVLVVGMAIKPGPGVLGTLRALTGMEVQVLQMSAEQVLATQREVYGIEVAEREHARAPAREGGVSFVSLALRKGDRDPVDRTAARLLSEELCRRLEVIAVAAATGVVVLASTSWPNEEAVETAASTALREPLLVVATPSDVEEVIERAFALPVPESVARKEEELEQALARGSATWRRAGESSCPGSWPTRTCWWQGGRGDSNGRRRGVWAGR